MEQFNDEERIYDYTKSFINNFGAMIFIGIAVIGIILVGSLSGFKEISAKKSDASRMMKEWRENNANEYPEEYVDIINYGGKDYYFVIDKYDIEGNILTWHFAYDSDLTYVFSDSKYWILTLLTIILALLVYDMNAKSTLRKVQESKGSKDARLVYASKKKDIMPNVEYLDMFLEDKHNAIYDREVRSIVRNVDINYDDYMNEYMHFEIPKWYNLNKWSEMSYKEKTLYKRLKYIKKKRKKINIQKLMSQDLIQDNEGKGKKKITLLAESPQEFLNKKLKNKLFTQILMTLISGLTVTFGIALGDWTVGIAYGFTIISSGITSIIVTTDYGRTTLRQRDVTRTNYLTEFENKIDYYKVKYEKSLKEEAIKDDLIMLDSNINKEVVNEQVL